VLWLALQQLLQFYKGLLLHLSQQLLKLLMLLLLLLLMPLLFGYR
jgi:hypothetical protein